MKSFCPRWILQAALVSAAALLAVCFLAGSAEAQTVELRHAVGAPLACPGCNLAGHDFSRRTLNHVNLAHANLSGANFAGATLEGVMLAEANLKGANFKGAHIRSGGGRPTSFMQANLSNADFTGATLSAADFQYANIGCANFTDADMSGVIAGELLTDRSPSCKAVFHGAKLSCSLAQLADRLSLVGSLLPQCFTPKPLAAAAAWSCPNANLSGAATLIYVSPTGQDTSTCGQSPATACLTLSQGLAQCTGSSCAVLAYYGAYNPTTTIALGSGRSLYGGCVTGTASPSNVSIVNAPAGGVPAFSASNVSSVVLQGLSVIGSSVPGSPTAGTASVAVSIAQNSSVALNYVTILAGNGGPGATGTAGNKGTAGSSASGQSAGSNTACNASGGGGGPGMGAHVDYGAFSLSGCTTICGNTSQTNSNCSGTACKGPQLSQCNGATGLVGSQSGGGAGGTAGGSGAATCNFSYCSPYDTSNGSGGTAGSSGACGVGGQPSLNINGSFDGGLWTASVGGGGSAGGSGAGGGGGGGGQGYGGVCFWVQSDSSGGNGGGGGAGSCGASPGTGGQQGGASISLAVLDQSTVSLNTVTITGGTGGTGGAGGAGASAVAGGTGASGASGDASNGGSGGAGGWGGASGGGAGGNGGPSFGIVFVSAPEASVATTVFYQGYSGNVGQAGSVPASVSGAPCNASAAGIGTPGRVTDYASFN